MNQSRVIVDLDIYFEPIKNHDYVITVDVARGVGIELLCIYSH